MTEWLPFLLGGWVGLISVWAFLRMGLDKRRAIQQRERISEAGLLWPVLVGGILGVMLGMFAFRHKTRKLSFQLKLFGHLALFTGVVLGGWWLFLRP